MVEPHYKLRNELWYEQPTIQSIFFLANSDESPLLQRCTFPIIEWYFIAKIGVRHNVCQGRLRISRRVNHQKQSVHWKPFGWDRSDSLAVDRSSYCYAAQAIGILWSKKLIWQWLMSFSCTELHAFHDEIIVYLLAIHVQPLTNKHCLNESK